MIRIKNTKDMGRGLFASENVKKCTLINISELLKISIGEVSKCPTIERYVFSFDNKYSVMALGLGSLFNHSSDNYNVEAWHSYKDNRPVMEFRTTKEVKKGQQFFIDYGKNYYFDNKIKKEASKRTRTLKDYPLTKPSIMRKVEKVVKQYLSKK